MSLYIKCTQCGSMIAPCACTSPNLSFFGGDITTAIPTTALPLDALNVYDQTEVNAKCKAVRKRAISDCKKACIEAINSQLDEILGRAEKRPVKSPFDLLDAGIVKRCRKAIQNVEVE